MSHRDDFYAEYGDELVLLHTPGHLRQTDLDNSHTPHLTCYVEDGQAGSLQAYKRIRAELDEVSVAGV